MEDLKTTLATYPYVIVRIACDRCNRFGNFRLVRLAAKYGADYPLDQLIVDLAHRDCGHRPENQRKGKRWTIAEKRCQAYFRDLKPTQRPPDLPRPPAPKGLRVVETDGTIRKPKRRAGNV
jgi:hypothetical protein